MPEISASKYLVTAGWQDIPHLTEKTKRELLEATPPYLRDARTKGKPSLGSGAIYPIQTSEFLVDPFQIPAHWPRAYGMDVGWKRTAAIWGALDRSVDCIYLYTEHYRGKAEPSIHATSIKARGEWIPGAIDPAAHARMQVDGQQLLAMYRENGLTLTEAENAVEAGIYQVWQRLSTSRLKVFSTLMNWLAEYRLYRRDEKGKIVKDFDHLMDATRYLIMMIHTIARVMPASEGPVMSSSGSDPTAGY